MAEAAEDSTAGESSGSVPVGQEGYLDKESKNSKWNRRYFILECNVLRYYKDKPDKLPEAERGSRGEIKLKRILSVDPSSTIEHRSCMELQTAGGPIFLSAYSDEQRETWMQQIRLAVRRLSLQPSTSDAGLVTAVSGMRLDERGGATGGKADAGAASGGGKSDASGGKPDTSGTKTRVVGGVVMRVAMKNEGDAADRTSDADSTHPDRVMSLGGAASAASSGATGPAPTVSAASSGNLSTAGGHRKEGARVVKSGFGVKQGHFRKNWKKRFFLLDPYGFAYYEKESDKEPLRNIPIQDILTVAECTSFSNRANVFQLVTSGGIYYVQAPSHSDMDEWVAAIQGEIHTAAKPGGRNSRRSLKV